MQQIWSAKDRWTSPSQQQNRVLTKNSLSLWAIRVLLSLPTSCLTMKRYDLKKNVKNHAKQIMNLHIKATALHALSHSSKKRLPWLNGYDFGSRPLKWLGVWKHLHEQVKQTGMAAGRTSKLHRIAMAKTQSLEKPRLWTQQKKTLTTTKKNWLVASSRFPLRCHIRWAGSYEGFPNGGTPKSPVFDWDFPLYTCINHPFWRSPIYGNPLFLKPPTTA